MSAVPVVPLPQTIRTDGRGALKSMAFFVISDHTSQKNHPTSKNFSNNFSLYSFILKTQEVAQNNWGNFRQPLVFFIEHFASKIKLTFLGTGSLKQDLHLKFRFNSKICVYPRQFLNTIPEFILDVVSVDAIPFSWSVGFEKHCLPSVFLQWLRNDKFNWKNTIRIVLWEYFE